MKETFSAFMKEFIDAHTDEQLSMFNEIKQVFKNELTHKGEKAEKEHHYLKGIYQSIFKETDSEIKEIGRANVRQYS